MLTCDCVEFHHHLLQDAFKLISKQSLVPCPIWKLHGDSDLAHVYFQQPLKLIKELQGQNHCAKVSCHGLDSQAQPAMRPLCVQRLFVAERTNIYLFGFPELHRLLSLSWLAFVLTLQWEMAFVLTLQVMKQKMMACMISSQVFMQLWRQKALSCPEVHMNEYVNFLSANSSSAAIPIYSRHC